MLSKVVARMPTTSGTHNGTLTPAENAAKYTHGLAGVDLKQDALFRDILWASMVLICVIVLLVRLAQMFNAHLRHLFTLSATKKDQQYWSQNPSSFWPNVKKHLLYAPLWRNRHNREIRLSSAISVGTLPSRFHMILLVSYLASNIAYCSILDYNQKDRASLIAELRGRSGALSVLNMIPLIILAGRNNPLIPLLRVSFDTYNLLHRWMGRVVVIEALIHTGAWATNAVAGGGWNGIRKSINTSPFLQYGVVGTFAALFILVQSPSAVRHAFYETFLHLHQLAAFIIILGVYMHLQLGKLPQVPYIHLVVALWVLDRCARFSRLIYCNVSREGCTTVTVEALNGDACRLTFDLQRPLKIKAGSHVYAYIPSVSLWMSHPFSVAWTDDRATRSLPELKLEDLESKTSSPQQVDFDEPCKTSTSVSLVISKRTGMTAKLFDCASASPNNIITIRGFIEGPYGGLESLHSYGTVIMFAGGIGITHQVSHVRDLVACYTAGTVAARKVVLVWSVRNTEHLEWVRPWMDEILSMPGRREVLKILIFVTKPRSPREVISPSATVQMYPGRADPQIILDKEICQRVGAMAVTVCGPGALADSVRAAVRKRVNVGSIDFIEESFTW
ncbi:MAG: hypothetical protein M1827_003393 [Pycnora praestabilis]|nr:MAG: hypothetical protein M1827_003393 [Pycnora praestabilis]